MSDTAIKSGLTSPASSRPELGRKPHGAGAIVFLLVLAGGLAYAAFSIVHDIGGVGESNLATGTAARATR